MSHYFGRARRHHVGTFMPGQCNFKPDMPLSKIPFGPKVADEDDTESRGNKTELLVVSVAVVSGVIIAGACFYWYSVLSRRRQLSRRSSRGRRIQENKMKEFLRNKMKVSLDECASTLSLHNLQNIAEDAQKKWHCCHGGIIFTQIQSTSRNSEKGRSTSQRRWQ